MELFEERIAEIRLGRLQLAVGSLFVACATAVIAGSIVFYLPYFQDPEIKVSHLKVSTLLYVLGLAVVHEALHAVAFYCFAKVSFGQIKLNLPYSYCRVPVDFRAYRYCLVFPSFVTGFLSLGWLLVYPSIWTICFMSITVAWGVGDIGVLLKLQAFEGPFLVKTYPSELGCDLLRSSGDATGGELLEQDHSEA